MTALYTTSFQEVDIWLSFQNGCKVRMVELASASFCLRMLPTSSVAVKVAPRYLICSSLETGVSSREIDSGADIIRYKELAFVFV